MNAFRRARARLRRLDRDDRGTSLLELVVGMALMAIFLSLFLGAVLIIFQTANKVQAISISASQSNQAFLRLDKTVRYASAISTPGKSGTFGDWYVEFDKQMTTGTPGDACTQLRIDGNQLQQRTWTVTAGTSTPASAWLPIANFVTNGSAAAGSPDVPFTLLGASGTASSTFQRLQLTLVTTSGNGVSATNRAQVAFTALNSNVSLASNATTCQQWGRP